MNDRNTEVLNQYELEIMAIRKGRGAWICETDKGLKLLREYKGTVKRLEFEEEVLRRLKEQGFSRVDQYVHNRSDELVSIAEDGTRYLVKDWFVDRECNLGDEREIRSTVSQIAALHGALRNVELREEWNSGSMIAPPVRLDMERHNKELKRARTYIRSKRKKTDFELCVIGNFEEFFSQAAEAESGMVNISTADRTPASYLCHGELNQHHLLMTAGGPAFIEFNRMHLGIQMTDLYHFMRKVMEKHDWDFRLGMSILEEYNRILPMSHMEREFLYYLFLYPEKYWKQINFYYNANKAWIPGRNIEKLKILEAQQRSRNHFLSNIK